MAPKRSCCIPFSCCCFSSSSSSDEKGQHHPATSAGARSSPSATDNYTIETLPGAPKSIEAPIPGSSQSQSPMKYEIEDVDDVNLNVLGTHQCDKVPVSESLNILRKSEGKYVNVNLNVPGAPQCNEGSSSRSSNVPMKCEGEDVDVNLKVSGATRCDEAPSSGSPNVPVDANLIVSGAPSCNEAPSSSSSSSRVATTSSSSRGATKSDVINTILHKDIDIDDLMKHISDLLKLREEEMRLHKTLPNPSSFPWPSVSGLKKLKAILSWETDLKNLKELLSSGLEVASELKDIISGPITTVLKDIGQASVATAGLLVVAYTLERFHDVSTNKEKCWDLIKEMSYVGSVVQRLKQSPKGTQENVIEEATALVVEGAIICCTQIGRSAWKSFFTASKNKDDLNGIREKLNVKYMQINIEIGFRVLTAIEGKGRSPLSKRYPTHAVGMDEPIKEVLRLLEIESDKNAVTVILHGFGGMGKTTLADAVFSHVGGCKYSKVRLFEDIDSKPVIIELQKQILKYLMEPGETIPEIRTHEDGQRELEGVLGKIHAFIYVDNVLEGDALKKLLPQDMTTAMTFTALFCQLRELCNDFHCLSSLKLLNLTECEILEKLPEDFHCLKSLQFLYLVSCPKLEGKSMDHVAKMNTLQVVRIRGSNELVKRWVEIQSECHGSSYPSVIISEDASISENDKENMKNSVLSELDGLITNGRGEPVHLSHLLRKTSTLLIFDKDNHPDMDHFPWPLIEETVDDGMQIKIIYIGPYILYHQLPNKVKDIIFAVHLSIDRTQDILVKVEATIGIGSSYLQMDAKMAGDGNSDNHGPSSCWRFLTDAELEEFVVCNSGRYLRLKQLAETNQESNMKLLIELFAPDGNETTPVFQKNESSQQQDRTENSERKTTTCGVDKLKGKTILVEMWPYESWRWENYDHQFWKEVYFMEKEKVDLEIISIPIVYPSKECDVIDVYKQFSKEVPWLVLQNSWTVITRAVKYFFEKHGGWEERDEICEKWYSTINWIIEPKGRISVYRPSIFLKEEWEQPKNMSTLEFLFNHLESVSPQVKKLMLPGKLICLYRGGDDDDEVLYSIWNALDQQQRDRIHIIHLGSREMESFKFTMNSKKDYYYPLKNTAEIEGMSSLNLSENEILRFSLRLCHLEKEINRMEDGELKFLLHSFQPLHSFQDEDDQMYGSIAFMDGGGKVVAALGGKILKSIFDRKDRAERFIKLIMNDIEGGGGGKEMHDEDPGVSHSLIQNLQTSSAAAVEQQNMDAYFDSLREYTSERWGVEVYQAFRLNKEGEKLSLPRVTWPTSKGFCRLKNFLSEGINNDWVKDVIFRHPEEKSEWRIVIQSLLKGIEEALWAVAGLLVVADLLERLETISANRIDYLFVLEKMFRVAQYIQQFNQKPGLSWRRAKCVAAPIILACSILCCSQIDESKFAWFRKEKEGNLEDAEGILTRIGDMMAEAITEGPSNESGTLLEEMCDEFYGFGFFLESGDEGGPSCEGESGVECGSTAGTSGEGESDVEDGSTAGTSGEGESDVEDGSTAGTSGQEE